MAVIPGGEVDLFYEEAGSGAGLVLVHGSWVDHHEWDQMMPLLARHFRAVSHDKRGHSNSPSPTGQGVVAAVVAHEPPGLGLLAGDPAYSEVLQGFTTRVGAVAAALKAGNYAQGAEPFVDSIALGPGSWKRRPQEQRETFVRNAPTFLDELGDPDGLTLDVQRLICAGAGHNPHLTHPQDYADSVIKYAVEDDGAS